MMKNNQTNRRKAYRTISIITTVVVILVVLGINIVVNVAGEKNNWNIDLSKEKYFSISDETVSLLDGLTEDVYIYTLFRTGNVDENISKLAGNYAATSERVYTENVDLTLNPGFTQKYDPYGNGVTEGSVIVTNKSASQYKVLSVFDLYKIDVTTGAVWALQAEQRITSAINYIQTGIAPSIKLLAGHGEYTANDLSDLMGLMQGLGYEVDTYDSTTASKALNPMTDTLMVVSPKVDLSDNEYEMLKQFLVNGGNALFLMDSVALDSASGMFFTNKDHLNNFNALLMRYDVQMNRNYILGDADTTVNRPGAHIPIMIEHEITNSLIEDRKAPVLADVSSLSITASQEPASGILLQTVENTWAKDLDAGGSMQIEKMPEDETGPFIMATVGEVGESRIAVFGTSSFVQSEELARTANKDLIINAVNSLADTGTDISITPKLMVPGTINLTSDTQKNFLVILVVVILPLAVIIFGLVVWLGRRRK